MYHTIGNHCLSVPRDVLAARMGIPGGSYRAVDIAPGWMLIILDTTEVHHVPVATCLFSSSLAAVDAAALRLGAACGVGIMERSLQCWTT